MVSLIENGTHVLFGTEWGRYSYPENALAPKVLMHLEAGMLCLVDRGFFGYALFEQAVVVRVIKYPLEGVYDGEPLYRVAGTP